MVEGVLLFCLFILDPGFLGDIFSWADDFLFSTLQIKLSVWYKEFISILQPTVGVQCKN